MPKKKKKDKKPFFHSRKKGNIFTIKTSLKSILKNYDVNFRKLNEIVIECNEIVIRTYQFIRLYLLDCYYKNKEFPILNKDNILYFIRVGGIRDNRGQKSKNSNFEQELEQFYISEFQPCLQKTKYNLINKSYLIPYLSIQIETSFNNNIKEHFLTRIRRFMNIMNPFDLTTDEMKKEFNKVKNLILLDKLDDIPENYKEWSITLRNNFLPLEYENVFGYDCKVNPEKYIYYTLKINEEIEKRNEEIKNSNRTEEEKRIQIKKLFQPIPLRNSIIPHYITLDANCILSLFGNKGDSHLGYNIKENKNYVWNLIFKTQKKVMKKKDYEFKSIQTDGIGVSICFQKIGITTKDKKECIEEDQYYLSDLTVEELNLCRKRKIIGIDPGKQNLVYMIDENKKKLRYTASQRRVESYKKKNSMILKWEKMNNCIHEEEEKLSLQNSKTVNYEKFKIYIKEKTKLNDEVRDFYERELFRKFKWRTWIYQKKSEDTFLNKIEKTYGKKEDILLCYGNWSQTQQMKYTMPTKGVGLRRIISKKFNVVLMDEFKTSKLCSCCHCELENYKLNEHEKEEYEKHHKKSISKLHRLLICKNCGSKNKNSVFMNRDMNACINILNLSKEYINFKTRNENFCRSISI